ncbi:MAG: YncE family protein [Bacteroidales bacterium]|nr:YncE family protein [Bacteroidales bacterium]
MILKSNISTLIGILFLALMFHSCMDDDLNQNPLHSKQSSGVFVVNEGNFTYSNASLSFYQPADKSVLNDVFYQTNTLPLGDVAQSIEVRDSLAYVVINNSGKIFIISTENFKYKGKITGFISPRHIHFVSNTKAYVSDLYAGKLYIIDPMAQATVGSIDLGSHASSENMAQIGNKLYLTCWSYDNFLLVIDTQTDRLIDSIQVGKQPNSLVVDKNQNLWVLSDGGFPGSSYGQEQAQLICINTSSNQIIKTFIFNDIQASPSNLQINQSGDSLIFLYGNWSRSLSGAGIYKMAISDSELPTNAFLEQNDNIFYAFGIDPTSSDIYVSNTKDFSSRGEVFRFSENGQAIDTFDVGINPTAFGFWQP